MVLLPLQHIRRKLIHLRGRNITQHQRVVFVPAGVGDPLHDD
jgi:hypothetical protein